MVEVVFCQVFVIGIVGGDWARTGSNVLPH